MFKIFSDDIANAEIKPNSKLTGAGATFDWLFFDNSKLINFDC